MNARSRQPLLRALHHAPAVLFLVVLIGFGALSPKFLAPISLLNLAAQAAPTAIVAVGMTFVLLTAGVDLSVGAIMYLTAAVGGKLVLAGAPLIVVLPVMLAIGLLAGSLNALLIARLGVVAFIATLGTQYLERGLGLGFTQTRAMNLPDHYTFLASFKLVGLPLPLVVLVLVVAAAHLVLTRTPFGRQVHAVGQDLAAARKAGIDTRFILSAVYVLCGGTAAIGGILSLAQLAAVAPTFGNSKEFSAIAAAVLGGTSLFGGRGQVFPGTVLGALLIQSVENGLLMLNADPYLYPLVTSTIIFVAVLLDSLRNRVLARLRRRWIRNDPFEQASS